MAFLGLTDLQLGFAAIGAGALALVFTFNKWQEHRHRKTAEKAFTSEHRDVLLEPGENASPPFPSDAEERVEPAMGAERPIPTEATRTAPPAGVQRNGPPLPADADPYFDCIGCFESIEPLEVARLWQQQNEIFEGLSKPIRWFGFDDASNVWRALDAQATGTLHWYCAALSLADRQGPISEADAAHFLGGFQRLADTFMAVPTSLSTRAETLLRAQKLDVKCAELDIQIGVNVVASSGRFEGARIARFAQQVGLTLGTDGQFLAQDAFGQTLYTLANLEEAPFTPDTLAHLSTPGVTFLIDVPRVARGETAFDAMLKTAHDMAKSLGGRVVDDNGAAISQEAATRIRTTIEHYQLKLKDADLPAGEARALRIFAG